MKNIHIAEGVTLKEHVKQALENALENGDDDFIKSFIASDAETIAGDLASFDAGVERHLELAGDGQDIAFAEVIGIVNEWFEEQAP